MDELDRETWHLDGLDLVIRERVGQNPEYLVPYDPARLVEDANTTSYRLVAALVKEVRRLRGNLTEPTSSAVSTSPAPTAPSA